MIYVIESNLDEINQILCQIVKHFLRIDFKASSLIKNLSLQKWLDMNLIYLLKMCKIYLLTKSSYRILTGYPSLLNSAISIKPLHSNCRLVNSVSNFPEDRKWFGLMHLKYSEMREILIPCFQMQHEGFSKCTRSIASYTTQCIFINILRTGDNFWFASKSSFRIKKMYIFKTGRRHAQC